MIDEEGRKEIKENRTKNRENFQKNEDETVLFFSCSSTLHIFCN